MGEVDGGAAWDGGADHGATRDEGAEQPRMGRGCRAAALEKATVDGCAACCKRPYVAALEKDERLCLFFLDTEVMRRCTLKQQAECECGMSGGTDACILSLPYKISHHLLF